MSLVKGSVQFIDPNKFGYTPYLKVNGIKYGGDTKATATNFPDIRKGDLVEFESFEKSGSGGKSFQQYKLQTLKKLAAPEAAVANGSGTGYAAGVGRGNGFAGGKDAYWTDRAAADAAKEPRISFQGAAKLAISFVDLALRNGALPLPKTDNKKLEVIQAAVDEQTQRFFKESFAATAPKSELPLGDVTEQVKTDTAVATDQAGTGNNENGEEWS